MSFIWNTLIYNPIFNALVWLYNVIPGQDFGVAIIVLTLLLRFALYPFTKKTLASQKAMQTIQPKVKALQEEFKDQKEILAQKLMELYKAEKVNPFSSCAPLLIQMPIIIAVYQVFRHGLVSQGFERLYPFVANPGHIQTMAFFGTLDLSSRSIVLAIAAGVAQFFQSKMMLSTKPATVNDKPVDGSQDEKMLAMMNKQMTYMMPAMTVFIGLSLPAGLSLYWFVSTAFMLIQQIFLFRNKTQA